MLCHHHGVSSRAKTKKKSRPQEHQTAQEPAPDATRDWKYEEGIALTKKQERWLEMFFGFFVFFFTAGGGTYALFESWIPSLACGTIAAIVAVLLVRRGETLF